MAGEIADRDGRERAEIGGGILDLQRVAGVDAERADLAVLRQRDLDEIVGRIEPVDVEAGEDAEAPGQTPDGDGQVAEESGGQVEEPDLPAAGSEADAASQAEEPDAEPTEAEVQR